MNNFWNERYNNKQYVYGEKPNVFLKAQLDILSTGKILFPAEGEGRNAVYAAKNGWDVYAFDPSIEGKNKALNLAKKNNTSINYTINSYETMNYDTNSFDVIGLTYTHMPASLRNRTHKAFTTLLKPGGIIILEAFSKEQINYSSGGPQNTDMLFSEIELREDFGSLTIELLEKIIINLDEGPFHQGEASVIRLIARKN